MEPKAKTLQERFGFSDPDLKTPKHDAIMMWLDRNIEHVLKRLDVPQWKYGWTLNEQGTHYRNMFEEAATKMAADMKIQIATELNLPEYPQRKIGKIWEVPILDRTYTIGFADMRVLWTDQEVRLHFDVCLNGINKELKYVDSEVCTLEHWYQSAFFEVKPSIPSVGELIRQLRMYRTYTGDAKWFVVSPDNRFESIIKDQGFGFVLVPESVGQP
jgi:hypothetical protein